jgi:hypothetical protein
MDAVVKRKIPSPRRESNPRAPIVQPVAQLIIEKYPLRTVTTFINSGYMKKVCNLPVFALSSVSAESGYRVNRGTPV